MSGAAHYAELLLPVLLKQEGKVHILVRIRLEYPSSSPAQCCHRAVDRRHDTASQSGLDSSGKRSGNSRVKMKRRIKNNYLYSNFMF